MQLKFTRTKALATKECIESLYGLKLKIAVT